MTFHYTDPDGDRLTLHGMRDDNDRPVVHFGTSSPDGVYVDVDRIEEVIAGLRDERRQAADGPNPQHLGNKANAEDCPACHGTNPPYPFLCPGGGS